MVLIEKIREVKTPDRGTLESAGIDFYIPHFTVEQTTELNRDIVAATIKDLGANIVIAPGGDKIIPSGIKAKFLPGHALIAFNKSGVSTKLGLTVGACVVDSDYQGEIMIHLINTTQKFVKLPLGKKIVQFVLVPIANNKVVLSENIHVIPTERGDGKCGSTGDE